MRSWTTRAGGALWVTIAMLACARAPQKIRLDYPHKKNELIVTARPGARLNPVLLQQRWNDAGIEILNERSLLLRFPDGSANDLEALARDIATDQGIQAVEPNFVYQLEDTVPNDSDFAKLYAFRNSGADGGLVGADMSLPKAWDATTGSASVVIGIVDSGADYTHPDLAENTWKNPGESGLDANGRDKSSNGIDDDGNGLIDDWHGWDFANNDNDPMDDNSHGTHVAGTIGARGNNSLGVVGVNWKVSMVPIKVFSGDGTTTTDALIKGVEYASTLGVIATNNSWGGGAYSDAMLASIQHAHDKGILFVAAAGNSGSNNDSMPHYPSSYDVPTIIAVAATDKRDQLASFSSYGMKSVQVAAPGDQIWSTLPGGGYGMKSGTSMATPHVTGLVALVKARFPDLDAQGIKNRIIGTSQFLTQLQNSITYGRVNAMAALEDDKAVPSAVQELEIRAVGTNEVSLSWKESGDDGEQGLATRYIARLSQMPIQDEADWNAAAPISLSSMAHQNTHVTAQVAGLAYNTAAYIAVRAVDNVGNISTVSPGVSFSLQPVSILVDEDGSSEARWQKLDAPWGFVHQDGQAWLADSPDGSYPNNVDVSAETVDFSLNSTRIVLDITTRYDLEPNWDYGFIELSKDQGQSWVELKKLNGSSSWSHLMIPLQDVLQGSRSFRLRFRLKTDYTISYEGWDIDGFQIIGLQP